MKKNVLMVSGISVIVTIFFVIAYLGFNVLGISQSRAKRAEITLVSATEEKVYDGVPLSNSYWYIESGELIEGDSMEVIVSESITTPGVIRNTMGVTILDKDGNNVTLNYTVILKTGTLTVHKRALTFRTDHAEKVYDGLPLESQHYNLVSGTLIESHRLESVMTATITEAETKPNDMSVSIYDEDQSEVTGYYEITYEFGDLVIHKRPLEIETPSAEKVYDGEVLSRLTFLLRSGSVIETHRLDTTMNASILTPGEVENKIGVILYDEFNRIVTQNYEIKYNIGTLVVYKRYIEIQTSESEKYYDGLELSNPNWWLTSGSLMPQHNTNILMNTTISKPGQVENSIGIEIVDEFNALITQYYDIHVVTGLLVVHKIPLVIETESLRKTYDDKPLTSQNWWINEGELMNGHFSSAVMHASITNVGEVLNEVSLNIFDEQSNIMNDYYEISYIPGVLTVDYKAITIQTETLSKTYDGITLTSNVFFITDGELLSSHNYSYDMYASITEPGEIENHINFVIYNHDKEVVSFNYLISYNLGFLRVNRRQLSFETESNDKVYDGKPLTSNSSWLKTGVILDTHHYEAIHRASITNVGEVENKVDVTIMDQFNNDVTGYYDITYEFGRLSVRKRPISVETESNEKVYDGSPLQSSTFYLRSGLLVESEYYQTEMSASITNPGSIINTIGITIFNQNHMIVTDNYDIELNLGRLSITKREIIIHTESSEKVYDGTPLENLNWFIHSGTILPMHNSQIDFNITQTVPGTKDNQLTMVIFDEFGFDVSNRYHMIYNYGKLVVHKRPLTFSTMTDEKVYDGLELKNDNWTMTYGSLVYPHRLNVTMNSSITNPGQIKNDMSVQIFDDLNNDVSNYYLINVEKGQLTVTRRELVIATESFEKVYDGQPLTHKVYDVLSGDLVQNHRLETVMNATITIPGRIENTITVKIYDNQNIDISSRYKITTNNGFLVVTKAVLKVSSASAEKVYDGTALNSRDWSYITNQLVIGHYGNPVMNTSITNPGEVPNDLLLYIYDEYGIDVSDRYHINYELGKLKVLPREVTYRSGSDEKMYDGLSLTNETWTLESGSLVIGHTAYATVTGSITNPGEANNTIQVIIRDESMNDVSMRYDMTYETGKLKVLPRLITISTNNASKMYDGKPLSNDTWALLSGELIEGHEINAFMNASIINPGTIDNTIGVAIFDELSNDVTSRYEIDYQLGKLEVVKRELIITSETDNKPYDGVALTSNSYKIDKGSVIDEHSLLITMNASITLPGSIDNTIFAQVVDSNLTDVSHLYSFIINEGTLTIEPIKIVLKSGSATKVYDGTPLTNGDYEKLNGTLFPNHELIVIVDGEITDVGSVDNSIFAYVIDEYGQYVDHYYSFDLFAGKLTVLTSLYSSDEIAKQSFDPSNEDVFRVFTSSASMTYFRDKSFGDYTFTGWNTPIEHNTGITVNPLSFASKALQNASRLSVSMTIELIRDQVPYLLPYHTTNTINQIDDRHIFGDTKSMNYNVINYTYDTLDRVAITDPLFKSEELIYRNHAYDYYLNIPESTKDELLRLGRSSGIDGSTGDIISEIKNYVQTSATYNKDFSDIPDSVEDIAIYFLTESKEGICQHFATAGTLMFRAYGIPARYVTGYVGELKGGQWNVINGEQAHAWVEIYIDNMGWVPIEVTGEGFQEEKSSLIFRPVSIREVYEPGKVLTAKNATVTGFEAFEALGYTYEVTFIGSLSTPGSATSSIRSVRIYDESGNDVTFRFEIEYKEGLLQMYMYSITFVTNSETKLYDGLALEAHTWQIVGTLASGHSISEVTFTGTQLNVGLSKNKATMVIHDEYGNDVTYLYNIIQQLGNLRVTPRIITVESASATKRFDGTSLTNHNYAFIEGDLAEGDHMTIEISGEQTSIGYGVNTIDNIAIFNSQNVEVTRNYIIELIEGDLIVTP